MTNPRDRDETEHRLEVVRFLKSLLYKCLDHALTARGATECLRVKRLALGIDKPILDILPIWAERRADGQIEIPELDWFLERLLAEANALSQLIPVGARRPAAPQMVELRAIAEPALENCKRAFSPSADPFAGQPVIGISELEALCGVGGIIDRLETRCRTHLAESARRSAA